MSKSDAIFQHWIRYFRFNLANLSPIPWDSDYGLSPTERRAITRSIQAFQLGESSEGHHFRRMARAWCNKTGDSSYLDALDLFIAEEQRHAAQLGRFMEKQNIARVSFNWTDTIFRFARRALNLTRMNHTFPAASVDSTASTARNVHASFDSVSTFKLTRYA